MSDQSLWSEISRRQLLGAAALGAASYACGVPGALAQSVATTRPAARRPNFLFIVSDQHRHDFLGSAGGAVRTEQLDALAKSGTRFTRAVCASPVCGPSRACLASGLEYDRCRVPNHQVNYPLDQITYYRLLRDAGYHVMGCGKMDLHKSTHDWGVDGQHCVKEWGFSAGIDNAGKRDAVYGDSAREPRDPYMAYLKERGLAAVHADDIRRRDSYASTDPTPLDEDAYCDNWIGRQATRLLTEAPVGKPWHLQVNFAGPHEPMDVTAAMHRWYRNPPVQFPPPHQPDEAFGADRHQEARRNYAAMIQNVDRWVGMLIEQVRSRGELDNTVIVYTSDHGEMLGDHGRWAKTCPYEASIRIPMIVAGPGLASGQTSDALVSLIDIGATFLDLAAVERPGVMQSLSLRPVLEGRSKSHRDHVLSGLGPWRMVFDGRHKLITGFEPKMPNSVIMGRAKGPAPALPPMLFDLAEDPNEDHNLADARPQELKRLADLLPGK